MFSEVPGGHDNEVEAKTGAVRISLKDESPILPVYIPQGKKVFGRLNCW